MRPGNVNNEEHCTTSVQRKNRHNQVAVPANQGESQ